MKSLCVNCKILVLALGAASCFIITVDSSVCAQGINPRATGASRRAEKMQRQNEEYERDTLEREMASGPDRANGRKNAAVTAQVKQDFEKLQLRTIGSCWQWHPDKGSTAIRSSKTSPE